MSFPGICKNIRALTFRCNNCYEIPGIHSDHWIVGPWTRISKKNDFLESETGQVLPVYYPFNPGDLTPTSFSSLHLYDSMMTIFQLFDNKHLFMSKEFPSNINIPILYQPVQNHCTLHFCVEVKCAMVLHMYLTVDTGTGIQFPL